MLQVRPDLDMAIRQLARFSKRPGDRPHRFAEYFGGYLQDTRDAVVKFNGKENGGNAKSSIKVIAASCPKTTLSSEMIDGKERFRTVGEKDHRPTGEEKKRVIEAERRFKESSIKDLSREDQRGRRMLARLRVTSRTMAEPDIKEHVDETNKATLEVITDANFGGDDDEHRSKYAMAVFFNGTCTQFESKMMGIINTGVMANEAHGLAKGSDLGEFSKQFLNKIDELVFGGRKTVGVGLIPMYVDNLSTQIGVMKPQEEYMTISAPPLVKIELAKLSNECASKERIVYHIGTKFNPADHGTKANSGNLVRLHSQILMNDARTFDIEKREKVGNRVRARLDLGEKCLTAVVTKVHHNGSYDLEYPVSEGQPIENVKRLRVHRSFLWEGFEID